VDPSDRPNLRVAEHFNFEVDYQSISPIPVIIRERHRVFI
jgi:hypothetical protein